MTSKDVMSVLVTKTYTYHQIKKIFLSRIYFIKVCVDGKQKNPKKPENKSKET